MTARLVVVALVVVGMALGLAGDVGARSDVSRLRLGIAGAAARFSSQTGQDSTIRSFFLGWEQGWKWGARFSVLPPVPDPARHAGAVRRLLGQVLAAVLESDHRSTGR